MRTPNKLIMQNGKWKVMVVLLTIIFNFQFSPFTFSQTVGNMSQADYRVYQQMNVGSNRIVLHTTNSGYWLEVGDSAKTKHAALLWGLAKYKYNFGSIFDSRSLIDKGYADSLHALKLSISDTTNKWVSNIWRVPGIDSIYFRIGNTVYAIKDSTGGSPYRFGKSGEDATMSENRSANFASTYSFAARHATTVTIDADSSLSSVGVAQLSLNKFGNSTYLGTYARSGSSSASFQSNWNSGNIYAEIGNLPSGNSSLSSYYRIYSDSTVLRLGNSAVLKAYNIPTGTGTKALRWDGATSQIVLSDTTSGGGGGTNNANVGSGFRILKPATQDIKTLRGESGILIDSSSHTDELTFKADTFALSTKGLSYKIIDSLKNLGWGAQIPASDPWYSMRCEYGMWGGGSGFDEADMQTTSSGTGSSATGQSSNLFAGWVGGVKFVTGTTSAGYGISYFSNGSSAFAQVVMDSLIRMNVGTKVRIDALSDGTDRFSIIAGLSDNSTSTATISDGAFFRYVDSDSSGKWIMCVYNNGVKAELATSTTVAINTDYELEISVFNGVAYFYINDVLTGTLTNVMGMPYGASRSTGLTVGISKSIGTNARNMWVDWFAYGTKKN